MLHKISDWIADACRWLWQAFLLVMLIVLLVMLIVLMVASVIAVITGITWCVIKLLAMLP